MYNYIQNFNGRTDLLSMYKDNALMLYALQLRYDIEDIVSVASDALTDGSDDKKCDLIYTDRESGFAVVAQAYMKKDAKEEDLAKANKASDLNTAASWIFCRKIDNIPLQIRDAVKELQEAIFGGDINTIYFWYVHNLNEKNNPKVQDEINTVQISAQKLVNDMVEDDFIKIVALEVGNNTIDKWYNSAQKQIMIQDSLLVDSIGKGFEVKADKWRACVTAVKGSWIKNLYLEYKDDLFSGNPRNYLGAGKRKNKINLGIMDTVEKQPENFWVFNNGLTALVNEYDFDKDQQELHQVSGITIINGAQSTGAIGAVNNLKEEFYVPIRFIVCNDAKIIEQIVNNNNKQNEILPSDLRSNDKQQVRLRKEFSRYPELFYSGGRRNSVSIRNKEVFDPYLVAQTLLSFHSDCVTAYNSKKKLWDEDKEYGNIFSDQLNAEHIIFVYSLGRAIDEYKTKLKTMKKERTEIQNEESNFLNKRGSKMLLIYVVGVCMESIMRKKILDPWKIVYKKNQNFKVLVERWTQVLDSILPFYSKMEPALEGGLQNKELSKQVALEVRAMIESVTTVSKEMFKDFVKAVDIEM